MDKFINKNKSKKSNLGIVFDENERNDYLKGFYGAKKKRKEFGKKKHEAFEKEVLREKRKIKKNNSKKLVEIYKEKFDKNNKFFKSLEDIKAKIQKQDIKTMDSEIEVTTTFL